jgi:RHS repeat-associated protein
MGRTLAEARTIGTTTATTQYAYNLDGSLQTIRYPSNYTVLNYTVSGAARVTKVQDATSGNTYVANATYFPNGALSSDTMGGAINTQLTYNNRLQPLQMFYGTNTPNPGSMLGNTCPATVGNITHRVYGFAAGSSDNGNVLGILNCLDSNRNVTFSYDSLNRIESAATQGATCSYCWGQLFGQMSGGQYVSGYDAWGNLHEITATQGSPTTLSLTVLPYNNRFAGMTYNADGGLKNDGNGNTYTYNDSEGRLTAANGVPYTYDGDGMRVQRSNAASNAPVPEVLYWRGTGSDPLAESGSGGTFTEEYVFFSGKRIARRDVSTGDVYYYFSDYLGSADTITNASGTIEKQSDYYPFGGEVVVAGSDPNTYKFTGKVRDSETGNDYFGARYYSDATGRWISPDRPFADQHPANPQSWNLYAYTLNNPLNNVDTNGLENLPAVVAKQMLQKYAPEAAGLALSRWNGAYALARAVNTVERAIGLGGLIPPQVYAANPKTSAAEISQANAVVKMTGNDVLLLDNPQQQGFDALQIVGGMIDMKGAIPTELKGTESSNPYYVLDETVDTERAANKVTMPNGAKLTGVEIFISAPNMDAKAVADFARNGPLPTIVGRGSIQQVTVTTGNGSVTIQNNKVTMESAKTGSD